MFIILLYKLPDVAVGFKIKTSNDIPTLQDGSDFSIVQNGISFFYNLTVISLNEYELRLIDNPLLPPEEQPLFDTSIDTTFTINVVGFEDEVSFIYDKLIFEDSFVLDPIGDERVETEKILSTIFTEPNETHNFETLYNSSYNELILGHITWNDELEEYIYPTWYSSDGIIVDILDTDRFYIEQMLLEGKKLFISIGGLNPKWDITLISDLLVKIRFIIDDLGLTGVDIDFNDEEMLNTSLGQEYLIALTDVFADNNLTITQTVDFKYISVDELGEHRITDKTYVESFIDLFLSLDSKIDHYNLKMYGKTIYSLIENIEKILIPWTDTVTGLEIDFSESKFVLVVKADEISSDSITNLLLPNAPQGVAGICLSNYLEDVDWSFPIASYLDILEPPFDESLQRDAIFSVEMIELNEVKGLLLTLEESLFSNFESFKIKIGEYKLTEYIDFPTNNYLLTTIGSTLEYDTIFIPFDFQQDMIYTIKVTYTKETSVLKPTILEKEIIPFKPTMYLCSNYYIKELLSDLEIDILLKEDFKAKYQIWKYSEQAVTESGLKRSSVLSLNQNELVTIADYVAYKIILQKFLGNILTNNIILNNQSSSSSVGGVASGINTIKLGDLQVSGDGTNVANAIAALKGLINDKLNELKILSNNRAFEGFKSKSNIETRNSILYPFKRVIIKDYNKSPYKYYGRWI